MSDNLINILSTLAGAIVGGIATYISENHFRKSNNKEQIAHYASILYYDLKSIEYYLKKEKSSVNIRYSIEWQQIVAQCTFLTSDSVEYIYSIYDYLYNYNYHFSNLMKSGNSFKKEDISEYNQLKMKFFDNSKGDVNLDKINADYANVLSELDKNRKN